MHALCEHLEIYFKNEVIYGLLDLIFCLYDKNLLKSAGDKLRVLAISGVWCQFGKHGIFLLLLLLDVFPLNTSMNFN